jgi:hypothetical protein
MATSGTYYLDAPSLSTATVIYSNAALTTVAANGFYSDGAVVREQVAGVLLPQQTCPSCITGFSSSVMAETSDEACLLEETTTYYNSSLFNPPGIVGIDDLVFEDANGYIPLAAGFYYAAGSIVGGNEWFQVNASGVVIAIGMCDVPPINCYVYEYINTTESTTFSFGPYPLCPGPGVFDIQIAPSAEGVTFCIEQLSEEQVIAFNAAGLTLTEGASICNS